MNGEELEILHEQQLVEPHFAHYYTQVSCFLSLFREKRIFETANLPRKKC